MRLLASVSPDVDRQGTPLDEALAASYRCALIWPLIGVNPVMSLQVRLAVEALQATLVLLVLIWWSASFFVWFEETELDAHGGGGREGRVGTKQTEEQTLLHDCQSHWKGRAVGSFSTNSISSISTGLGDPVNISRVLLLFWSFVFYNRFRVQSPLVGW
jgi:hypothetical protein